ncbi:hypothetical protein GN956_G8490 [Arapaima gigas]
MSPSVGNSGKLLEVRNGAGGSTREVPQKAGVPGDLHTPEPPLVKSASDGPLARWLTEQRAAPVGGPSVLKTAAALNQASSAKRHLPRRGWRKLEPSQLCACVRLHVRMRPFLMANGTHERP